MAARPLEVRCMDLLRSNDRKISGMSLAEGLKKYSERGDVYIEELKSMIRYNRLHQLDSV